MSSRALRNAMARDQTATDDPVGTFHDLATEIVMAPLPPDGGDLVIAGARSADGGFAYIRMTEEAAREFIEGLLWSMEKL